MIHTTTNPGTGILVFDTTPTCTKVYVDNKLYGTTEIDSLQIMNANPGRYKYSLQFQNKYYENDAFVQPDKITHIYFDFNNNIKKEEVVYIGTSLTNFSKQPQVQPQEQSQKEESKESKESDFKLPFDNDEPILKDEPIAISKHVDYYDIANTITTAAATDPKDFDSTVYNKEQICKIKGRYAEKIAVLNDGSDTLYVIISHGTSTMSYSKEVPIYAGEAKTYYNVYEIRLRSPTAGLPYRVAEYDIRSINAILKGTDGTNLQTVSVDSDGNILSVMKGNYNNTLKTISVDNDGRMIGLIKGTVDSYGAIIMYDSFESPSFAWLTSGTAGYTVSRSTYYPFSGDCCLYLKTIAIAGSTVTIGRYQAIKTSKIVNLETRIKSIDPGNVDTIQFILNFYNANSTFSSAKIRYDSQNGKWQIYTGGAWTDVSGMGIGMTSTAWNYVKISINFNTLKYIKLEYNSTLSDISSYAIPNVTFPGADLLDLNITVKTKNNVASEVYIDSVLLIDETT